MSSENAPQSLIDQNILKAGHALTCVTQAKSNTDPSRQEVLGKIKELVADARHAGVSYDLIAKTLSNEGLRITRHDVMEFCRKQLGEKKRVRTRKKPRQTSPNPLRGKAPHTGSRPSGIAPGFRVAKDEDL